MNKTKILLIAVLILAALLRIYRLDSAPPSLSWDEAAVGYNGWTIANFGRDEYGKFFPLYFRSFGDDKHPTHIYLTALSVKFLGLSEFSTRFPSAIFGVFNVLLIFLFAKLLFKSDMVGLFSSFFLAISPYNIHFSRFNHEANFALFFFLLGLIFFYLSLKEKGIFLPASCLSFAITFLTYHPSKVVVPLTMFLLFVLYSRKLIADKKNLLIAFGIILILVLIVVSTPRLLGIARIGQTSLGREALEKTAIYQLTQNELLGRINLVLTQYSWHFSPEFLFISGDKNPRLSNQATGQFYKLDTLFLVFGLIYLLYKRSKEGAVVLLWALIAPLPSALVAEAPHSARAMFMMGSWNLISALGLYFVFSFFRKRIFKRGITVLTVIILLFFLSRYLSNYYGVYIKNNAIDWQYGMKQIVEYIKDHQEYPYIYMTNVRSQPYIFFLYYLRTPLPEYLNSVTYNPSKSKSYNTVSNYNRYYFAGWDETKDLPNKEALYILTPSEYDGLMYRSDFDVKKVIYYPNGTVAFFIVSMRK